MKKLKIFDSSYFISKSHFEEDSTQNYLVFQPMYIYFNQVSGVGSGNISIFGNLKDCLMKILQLLLQKSTNSIHYGIKMKVEFKGSYFKQDKVAFNHGKIVLHCL